MLPSSIIGFTGSGCEAFDILLKSVGFCRLDMSFISRSFLQLQQGQLLLRGQ